ncbi:PREDICTED: uncharacterized protein LOC106817968 [Priapulus caudatus]|uniref:Uncharacterized protein LOC106817968 n=1 Tax=Priapulus caudatus TaxID=37621 RepID=A0ABM1F137_PRICU|nr:PREDICTED: uncharacterized protein LOC106817968 [Priapulus caudatus]
MKLLLVFALVCATGIHQALCVNNCASGIVDANALMSYKRGTAEVTSAFVAADVATITCNDKFHSTVTTSTCTNDGTDDDWIPAAVACSAYGECTASASVLDEGSTLTYSGLDALPESATVSCGTGYTNVTSYCTGETTYAWVPAITNCTMVQCDAFTVENGVLNVTGTAHDYGTGVEIDCEEGYEFELEVHEMEVACGADGKWSPAPGVCAGSSVARLLMTPAMIIGVMVVSKL